MRLLRLRASRLPGIEPPGIDLDGLDAPIVVIHGPNASGKSSLARALRALLWAEEGAAGIDARADLRAPDGASLVVTRLAGPPVWLRDGVPSAPPTLAPQAVADGLVIGLDDLVRTDHPSVGRAADDFRRALTGGVDVAAARASTAVGSRVGTAEERNLRDRAEDVRAAQARQATLEERAAGLDALARELDEARAAADVARTLGRAADLAEARAALARCEEALRAQPAGLARVRADDPRAFELLATRVADADAAVRDARAAAAQAREEAARAPLGEPLDAAAVAELDALLDGLVQAEAALVEAERAHAAAAAAARSARDDLAGADAPADLPAPAPADVREAIERAEQVQRLGRELHALDALGREGEEAPAAGDDAAALDAVRRVGEALDDWLATPAPSPESIGLGAFGGLLVVAGLLLALLMTPWMLVVAVVGGLLVGAGVAGSVLGQDGATRRELEASITARAPVAGLAPPRSWVRVEVRAARESAAARRATLDRAAEEREAARRARAERGPRRRALQEELDAAEAAVADLHRRVALATGLGLAGAAALLRAIGADADARAALARAAAGHEDARERRAAAVRRLAGVLAQAGAPADVADAAAGRRERERLVVASERLLAVRRALTEADASLPALEAAGASARAELAEAFAVRGLAAGDRNGLQALLAALPRHEELVRDRDRCAAAVAALELELGDEAVHADAGAGALRERAAEAESRATRHEGLLEERSRLEAELRSVGAAGEVAEALAARDQARDLLDEVRARALATAARDLLLERAERDYEAAALPAVQRDAAAWFATFTKGAFVLEPPRAGRAGFHARDTKQDVVRPLAELSTGTRAQLLLAARLAWASNAEPEGGLRAPLVLDEALASTDPERFDAIVAALGAVAQAGRQVLILTAEPDEARRVAAAAPCEVRAVDLGAALRQGEVVAGGAPAGRRTVPGREEDEAYDAWLVRILASRLDPLRGAGAMHVGHLLREDDALVARLLALGVETAGSLGALLAVRGDVGLAIPEAEVAARLAAAEAWCAALAVGRPRPVDGIVVGALGALASTSLRPQVVELVEVLREGEDGVPATRVVQALRGELPGVAPVARLRRPVIEALEQELIERGAIPVVEPLPREVVLARALAPLASLGPDEAARLVAAWDAAAVALDAVVGVG